MNSAPKFANKSARVPRGYLRPMAGWWRRNPYFQRYMVREATALAVLVYSLVLAAGVACLALGASAWEAWCSAIRSPAGVVLHVVLLAAMLVHAYTWFEIMPKTMPMIVVGGRRLSAPAIRRVGWALAVLVPLGLYGLMRWWPR